jgi:rRNA processing protein Krr1/Pno1
MQENEQIAEDIISLLNGGMPEPEALALLQTKKAELARNLEMMRPVVLTGWGNTF